MQDRNRNSLAIQETAQESRVSLLPLFSLMYMMVDGSTGLDLFAAFAMLDGSGTEWIH
jgi:hypothetical protein